MASDDADFEGEALPHISEEDMDEIKAAIEKGDLTAAAAKAQEILNDEENIQLHIAVTGDPGAGKSSFINAVRSLEDHEEGAAATGVMETTMECIPYPHPEYSNVTFWDLPGIGTPNFKPDNYFKQVNFNRYDFFIIISSSRFSYNAATLAKAIHAQRKRFYFVHSKVDQDVSNERKLYDEEGILKAKGKEATVRRPQQYDERAVLDEIRQDCEKNLADLGISFPQVFLVCRDGFGFMYDGPRLLQTFLEDLPSEKKLTFLRALDHPSKEVLRKKKEELMKHVWLKSLASGGVSIDPTKCFSTAFDSTILVTSLQEYCQIFGLSEESLQKLARQVNKPVEELKAVIKSPLLHEISKDLAIKLLTKSFDFAVKYAPLLIKFLPKQLQVIGNLVSAGIAFFTMFFLLRKFISDASEAAECVLLKALEEKIQRSHRGSGQKLCKD